MKRLMYNLCMLLMATTLNLAMIRSVFANSTKKPLEMAKDMLETYDRVFHRVGGNNLSETSPLLARYKKQLSDEGLAQIDESNPLWTDFDIPKILERLEPALQSRYGFIILQKTLYLLATKSALTNLLRRNDAISKLSAEQHHKIETALQNIAKTENFIVGHHQPGFLHEFPQMVEKYHSLFRRVLPYIPKIQYVSLYLSNRIHALAGLHQMFTKNMTEGTALLGMAILGFFAEKAAAQTDLAFRLEDAYRYMWLHHLRQAALALEEMYQALEKSPILQESLAYLHLKQSFDSSAVDYNPALHGFIHATKNPLYMNVPDKISELESWRMPLRLYPALTAALKALPLIYDGLVAAGMIDVMLLPHRLKTTNFPDGISWHTPEFDFASTKPFIKLTNGTQLLIENSVPLSLSLNLTDNNRTLLITGPNGSGKTTVIAHWEAAWFLVKH